MAVTWRIEFIVEIGGVRTDLDAVPRLSSSDTPYYGVKNTSTGTVIVDDNTAMTWLSDGYYYYDITVDAEANPDHADPSTQYTYSVEWTLNDITQFYVDSETTEALTAGEPTTTPTYADLQTAIQDAFKDMTDVNLLSRMIKEGYLMFLYPPDVAGKGSHVWSFLSPSTTLSLTASDYDYDLPAAFGGLVGSQLVLESASDAYDPVRIVTPEQIHRLRLGSSSDSGVPQWAAVEPKAFVAATGTRWQMVFWPTPDASYTARYRYNVNPDAVASGEYPIGGAQHAATIRAACRAKAEQLRSGGARGHYYLEFVDCLRASISQDEQFKNWNGPVTEAAW